MKRKLAIFMSFVMLFSTAVILPADKEHPAKAEETVTASGYWTDVAEPFQTKDASGNVLGDSRDNPILIESAEQLAYLAKEINEGTKENNISRGKYYRLEKNIDLSGKYWTAIGIYGQEFQGSFNGNGKVIQGLTVDETKTKKTAGFFGDVYAIEKGCGLLEDITILGADIKGTYCYKPEGGSGNDKIDSTGYGAILAASVFGNDKENAMAEVVSCRVQGKLVFEGDWADGDGETAVGGIAGYTSYAYMSECKAQVNIYGDGRMGGFIAVAGNKSQFISCRVMGVVDGGWGVGGFVGEAWEESTFKYCCANVTVYAYDWNSGGFAGYANEMPQMLGCVALGNVASNCVNGEKYWSPQSGGFIGYCNGTVENCYALGKVSCINEQYPAAGFAGVNVDGGTIKNSYYNSGQPSYCSGVNDNRTGDSSTCEVTEKDLTELNKELHENIGHAYSTKWENISLAEGCAEGYTGDIKCAYDSKLVAAGQVYQLKAHSWDEGVITTQPQPARKVSEHLPAGDVIR